MGVTTRLSVFCGATRRIMPAPLPKLVSRIRELQEKQVSLRLAEMDDARIMDETAIPGYSRIELTMGDASLDLTGEEIRELWQSLFSRAEA